MLPKPIIFLAFANDPTDAGHFLRNLDTECQKVQAVLKNIEGRLCQIKVLKNATIDHILEVFNRFPNRIAIFHFGGHAGGDHLALEVANKDKVQLAHAEGFADFLGQQSGLELVFLNGCSTQNQVENLLEAKVGAVIATSQAIDDKVATEFAIRFYSSLAAGDGIEQCFREAAASVKITKSTIMRRLYSARVKNRVDRFPWDFYVRKGADKVRTWNLPFAAKDPLFSLPPLPPHPLPEKPYRYLEWFREADAELFFGRDFQIWELYDKVKTSSNSPNASSSKAAIIHLYGQSGVGKSSLLAGGLSPRLRIQHEVVYIRRNPQKGLVGVLEESIKTLAKKSNFELQTNFNIEVTWRKIEAMQQKPLVLIIDQVEEAYTRPFEFQEKLEEKVQSYFKPELELQLFIEALREIFEGAKPPMGKVILAYRKEYLAEIKSAFERAKMDYTQVFLERLKRNDLIQAINGITERPRTKEKYNLSIETLQNKEVSLAEQISDDLLKDPESPIAPVLQILLSRMWEMAVAENAEQPVFRWAMYRQLSEEGLWMDSFLRMQLRKLEGLRDNDIQTVRSSGLLLDILASHVTELGTATSKKRSELLQLYAHKTAILPKLLDKLQELYLLIDPNKNDAAKARQKTRLAHDTLAKWIAHTFNSSNAVGQQAQRILRNQIDFNQFSKQKRPLDQQDIRLVQEGRVGMRALNHSELHLVLSSQVLSDSIQDPTVAFRLTEHAFTQLEEDELSLRALYQSFYKAPHYQRMNQKVNITDLVYAPDERLILLLKQNTNAEIFDTNGKKFIELIDSGGLSMACFSNTQPVFIVGLDVELQLKVWNEEGKLLRQSDISEQNTDMEERTSRSIRYSKISKKSGGKSINWNQDLLHYSDLQISENDTHIHLLEKNGTVEIFDENGQFVEELGNENSQMEGGIFRPKSGGMVFFWIEENTLIQTDLTSNKSSKFLELEEELRGMIFSTSGNWLLIWSEQTLQLVDVENEKVDAQRAFNDAIISAAISEESSNGLQIVATIGYSISPVLILNQQLEEVIRLTDNLRRNSRLLFDRKAQQIWALSKGEIYRWMLNVNFFDEMEQGLPYPNDMVLYPSTQQMAIAFSNEVSLRNWGNNRRLQQSQETDSNSYFSETIAFSPNGKMLATGGTNAPIRLWNNNLEDITPITALQQMRSISFDQLQNDLMGLMYEFSARDQETAFQQLEEKIHSEIGHKAKITSLAFSPDGKLLASASEDSSIKVWQVTDGACILTIGGGKVQQQLQFLKQEFQQDEKRQSQMQIQQQFSNPSIADFSTSSPSLLSEESTNSKGHSEAVTSIAWSKDGQYLVSASADGTARIWDLKGKEIQQLKPGKTTLYQALFSSNDQFILTTDTSGKLTYWDKQGQVIWQKEAHKSGIQSLRICENSSKFVTASRDKTAKVWNQNGNLLAVLEGHQRGLVAADFVDEAGNWVYTVSEDGSLRKWLVNTDLILERTGDLYQLEEKEWKGFGVKI